jgi:hypothetical protein
VGELTKYRRAAFVQVANVNIAQSKSGHQKKTLGRVSGNSIVSVGRHPVCLIFLAAAPEYEQAARSGAPSHGNKMPDI